MIARLADSGEMIPTLTGKPNRIVAYEPTRHVGCDTEYFAADPECN